MHWRKSGFLKSLCVCVDVYFPAVGGHPDLRLPKQRVLHRTFRYEQHLADSKTFVNPGVNLPEIHDPVRCSPYLREQPDPRISEGSFDEPSKALSYSFARQRLPRLPAGRLREADLRHL